MLVWGYKDGPFTLRIYKMHGASMEKLREGDRLRISVDKDRNGKFSSLYHVLLGKLADAINRGPATASIDTLKKWVKLKKGWYDVVTLPRPTLTGETSAIEYHSTSFATMGESEFEQFAKDTCELIVSELAPWVQDAPEWNEIQKIIAQIAPEVTA